jgi:hypothetical protein
MKYKYKYKNRPLRLLKDKDNLPYIKYKNKNISLKGYNIQEIIKIINKLTKQTKKKKLEPQEQKKKKDKVKEFLSDAIASSSSVVDGKPVPIVSGSIKEDTEKIKELSNEIQIYKSKVLNSSNTNIDKQIKNINKNIKSIENIKNSKQKFKNFLNYDNQNNEYSIDFGKWGIIKGKTEEELKQNLINEYEQLELNRQQLDQEKQLLNDSMSKLEIDFKKVKKDKIITENEKNKINYEKNKIKFITDGLKKTSVNMDKIKTEYKIPNNIPNLDNKFQLYEYIYESKNPKQIEQQIPEDEQEGEGKSKLRGGLWTNQINKIMEVNKYYIDTIANNEIDEILNYIYNNNILKGSFIMNTLNSYDKSVGHWVAIYYDVSNDGEYTLEYYDPFGNDPENNKLISKFKKLFEKMGIDAYVKVKINKIKQQSITSSNCGWFSIKFLLERLNGISFKDATKYKKISNNEQDITEIKKHYNKYGFI